MCTRLAWLSRCISKASGLGLHFFLNILAIFSLESILYLCLSSDFERLPLIYQYLSSGVVDFRVTAFNKIRLCVC